MLKLARRLNREACRTDLLTWCKEALHPIDLVPAAHHRLLIGKLQDVAQGRIKRLMIHMPPGGAKSTYGSVLFPPWFLAQRPGLDIIGASNTAPLAEGFSRRILNTIRDNRATLGYGLTREAAELWETSNRGTYRAAGVGAAIAGRRADGAIIDDPVKSREDVEGEGNREKQWAWFMGDLRTRLKPNAWIVIICTRWHEDDLAGRLLVRQPGLWEVLNLPAEAEADDPLGRAPGEWLWSDDEYGYGASLVTAKREYEIAGQMRDWASLYQQRPVPLEGNLFKVHMIETLPACPRAALSVRAWDLAATVAASGRDPDWTAGVKLTRTVDGRFVVEDVVRLRGGPDEVEAAIVNTAKADGAGCKVSIPQDPGQAGKQQVLYLTRKLAGFMVDSSPETGDKTTRATSVASQANVGNLSMVAGPWNPAFKDELASFPSGTHDDQVDALSRGFGVVGMARTMVVNHSAVAQAMLTGRRR